MLTIECLPGLLTPVLPNEFHLVNESRAAEYVIAKLLEARTLDTCAYTDAYLDHGAQLRAIARKLQARTTRREHAWNALFTKGN